MKLEIGTLGRLTVSLGILFALGGCSEMDASTVEAEGESKQGDNGLGSINGLSSFNGLGSVNGLSSFNGLASVNGLASMNGLMTTFEGRQTVSYMVKCALASGTTLKKKDHTGKEHTFSGGLGLGSNWLNNSCDAACQEGISACMMAHVNTAGVHIPLWMVSPAASIGWGKSASYPNREGTYFGNLFQSPPKAYYCNGPNFATSTVPGRLGAYQSNKPYTNPFGQDALCSNSCVAGGPQGEGYTSCNGFKNPVTVWRQPACGFDSTKDFKICAKHSGKCLDASIDGSPDGAKLQQWSYGGSNNQKWKITSLGDNYFKICNKQSGRCIDLDNGNQANGAKVALWNYSGADWQRWAITSIGTSGTGDILGAWSGNSATYPVGSRVTHNGVTYECLQAHTTNVAWTPNVTPALWKVSSGTSGTKMYSIVAKMGAKSLDVFDHLTTDGAKIQQWHYLGESQQQWIITQL